MLTLLLMTMTHLFVICSQLIVARGTAATADMHCYHARCKQLPVEGTRHRLDNA